MQCLRRYPVQTQDNEKKDHILDRKERTKEHLLPPFHKGCSSSFVQSQTFSIFNHQFLKYLYSLTYVYCASISHGESKNIKVNVKLYKFLEIDGPKEKRFASDKTKTTFLKQGSI